MDADITSFSANQKNAPSKVPWAPLVLFMIGLIAVNMMTLSRMPFVWFDEVYFAEPAMNLSRGEGFISRAWDHSPETRTVSSTSPLYSLTLAGWMKLFGDHLVAIRALGLSLTCGGLILLWCACQSWRVLVSSRWLIAISLTIACSYAFSFSYRSVRPEPLLFLMWALLFYVASWKTKWRFAIIFATAVLMPFAGQIACMALAILVCTLIILSPRRWLLLSGTVIAGLATGTLIFVATYKGLGIWADFQIAVNKQGGSPLLRLFQRLTSNPIANHSNVIPKDFSVVPLFAGLIWTAVLALRKKALRWNSLLMFGLLYSLCLPVGLYLFGKFPTYYAWMWTIPLAIVLCVLCWKGEAQTGKRFWIPRLSLAASCIMGLPLQLASASTDWSDRDYGLVKEWTKGVLNPTDVALVDYPFYYAARKHAAKVYLYGYGEQLRPEDVQALTVLILSPHRTYGMNREELMQKLGLNWVPTGESRRVQASLLGNDWQLGFLSLPNYDGDVYRRNTETSDSTVHSSLLR